MRKELECCCDHVGLVSNRGESLARFYVQKLGFRKQKEEVLPRSIVRPIFGIASECLMIKLAAPARTGASPLQPFVLEIFEPLTRRVGRRLHATAGYHHWGFRVGDREKYCRMLKRKGVPLIEVSRNAHRVYFFKDPDGNRVEIRS